MSRKEPSAGGVPADGGPENEPILWMDNAPVLLPPEPQHEAAAAAHEGWANLSSQRHVHSLALDRERGDLWLATAGGVLRWSGNFGRYTRYTSEHNLPGNSVLAVAVAGGRVWAVHETLGLSYFEGGSWRRHPWRPASGISCVSLDGRERLWLGTPSGVFAIADADAPRPEVELSNVSDPPRGLAVADDGTVWLSTARSLSMWQCDALGRYDCQGAGWMPRAWDLPQVLALAWHRGALWLGTVEGLIRIEPAATRRQTSDEWPHGPVTALAPSRDGVLAAAEGVVGLATEDSWLPVSELKKGSGRVSSLALTDGNDILVGAHGGLLRCERQEMRWTLTGAPPDVVAPAPSGDAGAPFSNMIQALAVEQSTHGQVLWVGTPSGLFRLGVSEADAPESWKRFYSRGVRDVRALAVGADGRDVWAASGEGGLYRLTAQRTWAPEVDASELFTAIAPAGDSLCWAASLGGLYAVSRTRELVAPIAALPRGSWVRALSPTAGGRLWLATHEGLFEFINEGRKLNHVLPGVSARVLLELPDGVVAAPLLVGTDRGLFAGTPAQLQLVAGTADRTITASVFDAAGGKLWVGTDAGLLQLTPAPQGWSVALEMTACNSGLAFDRVTALALSHFTGGPTRLWIGTTCGLSSYSY